MISSNDKLLAKLVYYLMGEWLNVNLLSMESVGLQQDGSELDGGVKELFATFVDFGFVDLFVLSVCRF